MHREIIRTTFGGEILASLRTFHGGRGKVPFLTFSGRESTIEVSVTANSYCGDAGISVNRTSFGESVTRATEIAWTHLRRMNRQKPTLCPRERSTGRYQGETFVGRDQEPTLFGFAGVETSRTAIPQVG